ncbi:Polysaccharide biosynthesis/export protein [Synechococcus sp. PCC 7335]|uniref:polysaccharide biosynthesis/export family protein n=1 Tax=Synechococcus sp. (strain ATCC 29403 / PCC 7335) TaxID=91464 RepID=UPI00017EBB95|nr:polysaccharide biosynthesis/export family protein [Synechococcus sp. PCC 7335]EDX85748.1 Polysaccharide biosynthesis/export protein [Synechococcus sp. PCC 7335]
MKSVFWPSSIKRIAAALSICSVGIVIFPQQTQAVATLKTSQTIKPSFTSTTSTPDPSILISQQEPLPTLPSSSPQPDSPPPISPQPVSPPPVSPPPQPASPQPISPSSFPPTIQPANSTGRLALPAAAPVTTFGFENEYVLGPGDEVRIDVFGAPEYSGEFLLLPNGTISLPVTGQISLAGLTLSDAAQAVTQRYTPYLRSPTVSLVPTTLRAVQIGVVGEVGSPGTYTIDVRDDGVVTFPSLTDALRLAGGITSRADIRQIEVYRPDRFGQTQVLQVNLWELLQEGNLSNDVALRSGDTVAIPVATTLTPEEAIELGNANFSPEEVTVFVIGESNRSGPVQVAPNTPLNQVLLAAGGFDAQRADRSTVGLVRLNPDGSVERRAVDVDLSDGINEETNPPLRQDDVVIVSRSAIANISDTVGLALSPVGRILGTFFGLERLFD